MVVVVVIDGGVIGVSGAVGVTGVITGGTTGVWGIAGATGIVGAGAFCKALTISEIGRSFWGVAPEGAGMVGITG